jgi:hypothetical protein
LDVPLDAIKQKIEQEAQARISAALPKEKVDIALTRAARLTAKVAIHKLLLTVEEMAEVAALEAMDDYAKAVRAKAEIEISTLALKQQTELEIFEPGRDIVWPVEPQ